MENVKQGIPQYLCKVDACLQEFEAQQGIELSRGTTLLAVSGGVDSMVLLHLFAQSSYPFAVAHVNFGLRNEASQADEALVVQTCEALDIPYHVARPDTEAYATAHKQSIQMAARALRYDFFHELMRDFGYRYLATAHHADDAIETLFIYLTRNNGRAALSGIAAAKDNTLRPLLSHSKAELLHYAAEKQLSWREDESNASTKYLRNKVRHWLIPALKEEYPALVEDYLALARDMRSYYAQQDAQLQKTLQPYVLVQSTEVLELSKSVNTHHKAEQIFEHIGRPLGFALAPLKQMLSASTGAQLSAVETDWELQVLHDRYRFIKGYRPEEYAYEIPFGNDITLEAGGFVIHVAWGEFEETASKNEYVFGINGIAYPLRLRLCQNGDTITLNATNAAKKLSDLFTNAHISTFDRHNYPVLACGAEVLAVVGLRRSSLHAVSGKAPGVRISWEPKPTL